MAYQHTNHKGQPYFLHGKWVTLQNGRQQPIFYFAREVKPADALDAIPAGYEVGENARTGLPYLYRAQAAETAAD